MKELLHENSERWANELDIARRFLTNAISGTDGRGRLYFEGNYTLLLNSGHVLSTFKLRVTYPNIFPKRRAHPLVHLLSHRDEWANLGDSHIEQDWKLCLYVPIESGLDFERWNELEELFVHVHTFLLRERFFQRDLVNEKQGGPKATWPGPDRAHGDRGLLQAIKDSGRKLGRNDPCVCGSGEKYKNCCRKHLWSQTLDRGRRVVSK